MEEARRTLADLMLLVASKEPQTEQLRLRLVNSLDFDPYAAFKLLDRTMRGTIDAENIMETCRTSEAAAASMVAMYDLDQDTRLTADELFRCILPRDQTLKEMIMHRPSQEALSAENRTSLTRLLECELTLHRDLHALRGKLPSSVSSLDLYRLVDVGSAGMVSPSDLVTFFRSIGLSVNADAIDNVFIRLDIDQDGALNFQDFTQGLLGKLAEGRSAASPGRRATSSKQEIPAKLPTRVKSPVRPLIRSKSPLKSETPARSVFNAASPSETPARSVSNAASPAKQGSPVKSPTFSRSPGKQSTWYSSNPRSSAEQSPDNIPSTQYSFQASRSRSPVKGQSSPHRASSPERSPDWSPDRYISPHPSQIGQFINMRPEEIHAFLFNKFGRTFVYGSPDNKVRTYKPAYCTQEQWDAAQNPKKPGQRSPHYSSVSFDKILDLSPKKKPFNSASESRLPESREQPRSPKRATLRLTSPSKRGSSPTKAKDSSTLRPTSPSKRGASPTKAKDSALVDMLKSQLELERGIEEMKIDLLMQTDFNLEDAFKVFSDSSYISADQLTSGLRALNVVSTPAAVQSLLQRSAVQGQLDLSSFVSILMPRQQDCLSFMTSKMTYASRSSLSADFSSKTTRLLGRLFKMIIDQEETKAKMQQSLAGSDLA
jgi:Ca2+-binding EF-hand superfamily protein